MFDQTDVIPPPAIINLMNFQISACFSVQRTKALSFFFSLIMVLRYSSLASRMIRATITASPTTVFTIMGMAASMVAGALLDR